MTTLFDSYVIVDWSARSKPSPVAPCKDAIWYAVVRQDCAGQKTAGKATEPVYCRTRHSAITQLADLLALEADAGRRVLIGFDFPFGYPAGVAQRICGSDSALDLWDWLAQAVQDQPDNRSNRFQVAARINRLYDGLGPFWGRPETWDVPEVPTRASARQGMDHPPEHRIADARAKGAKTVWQLAYAGSVGSQVILGLPALHRLCQDPRLAQRLAVWPFHSGLQCPDTQIVLAEIFPSLLQSHAHRQRRAAEVLDSAQVRVSAKAFAGVDLKGDLAAMFAGSADLDDAERDAIIREEAWILGLGHETRLQNAATEAFA